MLYTLVTFVGAGGACLPLIPGENDAGRGVTAGLNGMAVGFAGFAVSPSPCLQSCRMWPDW